ncbi:HD domain-containing phosphohydrolase [Acidobacteriota bacterium]
MGHSRFLIVDDDEHVRKILCLYLDSNGYKYVAVETGEQAIESLGAKEFDCVVCDYNLPGIKGEDVLEESIRRYPATPVIMLTGCVHVDLAVNLMKRGAFDFLPKPVSLDHFSACLAKALRHRNLLIDNRRLEMENRSYQRQLEKKVIEQTFQISSQGEFVNRLNSLQNLGSVVELVEQCMKDLLGCSRVTLLLQEDLGVDPSQFDDSEQKEIGKFDITRSTELLVRKIAQDRLMTINGSPVESTLREIIKDPCPDKAQEQTVIAALNLDEIPYGILVVKFGRDKGTLDDRDTQILRFVADSASIAIHNQLNRMIIEKGYLDTVKALALAVEAKDPYTCGHSDRVRIYSEMVGRRLNLPDSEIKMLSFAGILHDIGKIGVPISIIHKNGKLSDDEFESIKKHPTIGEKLINHIAFLKKARKMIRHHHERWDGKGYPDRVKGEEICLGARILAVADTFDAMTTDRPYRKAFPASQALEELVRCAAKQFDRNCVKAFMEIPVSAFLTSSTSTEPSLAPPPS